jgi:hypothetical protein
MANVQSSQKNSITQQPKTASHSSQKQHHTTVFYVSQCHAHNFYHTEGGNVMHTTFIILKVAKLASEAEAHHQEA